MSANRIEALEQAVAQLAQALATTAQAVVAQGIVTRAAIDSLTDGGGSLDDVRDRALDMAEIIGEDLIAAVRTILAVAPAGMERMQ